LVNFQTDILPLKDKLFRMALRITLNTAEAEDVVQDTMLRVWNRREQWDQLESVEAFCMTICRNQALDKLRRMGNQEMALDTEHDPTDHHYASNPEEQTVQHDRVRLVRQLISQLPEKQRTAMQLRDFEGKSYRDIAEIMQITEDQVKVNIFRARRAIKEKFLKIEKR